MRLARGTAPHPIARFDLTDVEADLHRAEWLERQTRRALDQRSAAFALGWASAVESLGCDVTITDGIPLSVE